MSKPALFFLSLLFFASSFSSIAQNNISVSFSNGFIGGAGNNKVTSSTSFTTYGWTNVQFSQNSSSNIFTAQGNDIPGNILITDFLGVERSIAGFIQIRVTDGSNVLAMGFSPTASVTLAT